MKDFVFLGATGFDWLKAVIEIVVAVIISKLIMLILPKIIDRFTKMPIEKSKGMVRSLLMPSASPFPISRLNSTNRWLARFTPLWLCSASRGLYRILSQR